MQLLKKATTRAGFTLVELLAVILILGILAVTLLPKIPEVLDRAEVTGCKKNMQEIYNGFLLYKTQHDKLPNKSGTRFFADLVASGTWENTKTSVKKLNCPGVSDPIGPEGLPYEDWYTDLEVLDGDWSTYAGRDCNEYPLRKLSGKQILLADDNDPDGNHATTTVALYGDGSTKTFELKTMQQDGEIDQDEEVLLVGPESPVEDLKKLSLD